MKYNLVITRTLKGEFKVVADSIEKAQEWVDDNVDDLWNILDGIEIIDESTELQEDKPSENEAEELLDLAGHITDYLHKYRHVGDYIPSEMFEALEKMRSHIYNED